MKTKNIFKYLMLIFLAVQLNSCVSTDAEQKFEDSPTERLNKQKKELNDLLLSAENGWKAVYYTDDSQLGGFTHLFKFLPDGKVDMASDFDDDTETYNSQYEIQLGSTVSLVFTTKNRIHLLSDANNSPLAAGKGFLGDFQFLYYGQENGDIIFKSNRTVKEIRFVKATQEDWDNLSENTIMTENMAGNNSSPLFRILETNEGGTVKKYELSFNSITRFATAIPLQDGNLESLKLAIAYTPTGITLKNPVVVGGQNLTDFIYNAGEKSFVATGTNGVTATIKFSYIPPRLTDDYKILLDESVTYQFSYYDKDTTADADTNSAQFKTTIKDINTFLADYDISLEVVDLYFNYPGLGDFIYYQFSDGSTFLHRVNVTEDAVGKKIILSHKSGNVPFYIKTLDNFFLDPQGLYVKKESFQLTYTNTIYTFTGSSSLFRMTTYKI